MNGEIARTLLARMAAARPVNSEDLIVLGDFD